jgi:hypothetical protein
MTTNDHTPLAARIAREHGFDFSRDLLGVTCKCGQDGFTVGHIVTVTEQAVRDEFEEELWLGAIYRAALRRLGTDPDELDAAFREGLNTPISRRLRRSARDIARDIARGDTR